jgi:hypothetical protein
MSFQHLIHNPLKRLEVEQSNLFPEKFHHDNSLAKELPHNIILLNILISRAEFRPNTCLDAFSSDFDISE